MLSYISQGYVAETLPERNTAIMNQRIQKIRGIVFLLITTSVSLAQAKETSDRQKNHSTFENTKTREEITVYARGTSYSKHTQTSSGVPIKTVINMGLVPVAVDPDIIPLGSKITGRDKQGREIKGVAVDEGPDVIKRKAAKNLALMKGYSKESPEYKALVFDFYAEKDITHYWSDFKVVPYRGKSFRFSMSDSERIAHLQQISKGG